MRRANTRTDQDTDATRSATMPGIRSRRGELGGCPAHAKQATNIVTRLPSGQVAWGNKHCHATSKQANTQTTRRRSAKVCPAHWSTASSASVPPEVCGVISTLSSSHSSGGGGPVNSPFCTGTQPAQGSRQHPRSVADAEGDRVIVRKRRARRRRSATRRRPVRSNGRPSGRQRSQHKSQRSLLDSPRPGLAGPPPHHARR